jgi:hypothetical protein
MSDFFASLAARVVRRPSGEEAVRPRLPAMFETSSSDASVGWSEQPADFVLARTATPAATVEPKPPPRIQMTSPEPAPTRLAPAPSIDIPQPDALIPEPHVARGATGQLVTPPPVIVVRPPLAAISPAHAVNRRSPDDTPSLAEPGKPRAAPVEAQAAVATSTIVVQTATTRPPPTAAKVDPAVPTRSVAPPQPQAVLPSPRIAQGVPPRAAAPPPSPETTIEVTIGRVEVRAAAPPAKHRPSTASPVMSLEEYLQGRSGRAAR